MRFCKLLKSLHIFFFGGFLSCYILTDAEYFYRNMMFVKDCYIGNPRTMILPADRFKKPDISCSRFSSFFQLFVQLKEIMLAPAFNIWQKRMRNIFNNGRKPEQFTYVTA